MHWIYGLLLNLIFAIGFAVDGLAQVGPIPGMGIFPLSVTPPSGTFVTNDQQSVAASTFTFSSENIGAADPTRLIAVVIGMTDSLATTAADPTGVTIAGISATKAVGTTQFNGTLVESANTSIWYASVPTGTTATIAVTYGMSHTQCGIGIFRFINLNSSTPFATGGGKTLVNSTGTTVSANLNVSSQGIAIGGIISVGGTSAPTYAWTGLTKSYDVLVTLSTEHSGALATGLLAATPLTVSVTATVASILTAATASWR
jgi:hypothetical protein